MEKGGGDGEKDGDGDKAVVNVPRACLLHGLNLELC